MTTALTYAAVAALCCAGGAMAARACTPGENTRAERIRDGLCKDRHTEVPYGEVGLYDARDLGQGFVSQVYSEGTACAHSYSMVVLDCARDAAAIFGAYDFTPGVMSEAEAQKARGGQYSLLVDRIEAAAKAGRPMQVAEIVSQARKAKLENAAEVSVAGKRIGITNSPNPSRYRYDLSCGCRLYYPESAGALQ